MEEVRVLTFINTSQVFHAEKLLQAVGIAVGLRPVPLGVASRCGLCIQIAAVDLDAALRLPKLVAGLEAVYAAPADGNNWVLCEEPR